MPLSRRRDTRRAKKIARNSRMAWARWSRGGIGPIRHGSQIDYAGRDKLIVRLLGASQRTQIKPEMLLSGLQQRSGGARRLSGVEKIWHRPRRPCFTPGIPAPLLGNHLPRPRAGSEPGEVKI